MIKKSLRLALGVALLLMGLQSHADQIIRFEVGDYAFSTLTMATVECNGFAEGKSASDVVIPDKVTYNGTDYAVTEVGEKAFQGSTIIKTVTIPEGISTLRKWCFNNCATLTTVNLPKSVFAIEDYAFMLDDQMTTINLPENLMTIGYMTFSFCEALEEVTFPPHLVSLDENAFGGCIKLKEAIFQDELLEIRASAFTECTSLKKVRLPESLTVMGNFVFSGCTSLSEVTIPSHISILGSYLFENCSSLRTVILPDQIQTIQDNCFNGCIALDLLAISTVVPPACESKVFQGVNTSACTLVVPQAGLSSYKNNYPWSDFKNITTEMPTPKVPGVIPAEAVPFAYYYGDVKGTLGSGKQSSWKVAMELNDSLLVGKQIVGLKVNYLQKGGLGSTKGWLSSSLKQTPDIQSAEGIMDDGTMTAVFDKPYTITDKGVYVGYDLSSAEKFPIPFANPANIWGTNWISVDGGPWGGYWKGYGAATIVAYLTGEFSENSIAPKAFTGATYIGANNPYSLTFEVSNYGKNAVTAIDYSYTINGQTIDGSATLDIPAVMGTYGTFTVDFAPFTEGGEYQGTITITKVNGVENTCANKTLNFTMNVLSFQPKNRPLMEEATGTWCGWCTRGWMGMKLMNEKYPEFVGLAWHDGDPMEVSTEFPFTHAGYPSAAINRTINSIDPYTGVGKDEFGIYDTYAQAATSFALADMDMKTVWGPEKKTLDVEVYTKFAAPAHNCKIGFILATNGLCHPDDPNWRQENYYSKRTDQSGYLKVLTEEPAKISGLTFDDVVIEPSAAKGVDGSLPADLEAYGEYTSKYTFQTEQVNGLLSYTYTNEDDKEVTAPYNLLENPDDVFVVAILLNENGEVLNSRKVMAGQEVGIQDNIINPSENATYYDMQGRQVSEHQHGIFIKKAGTKAVKIAK